jgi:hypothetical protein
MLLQLVAALPTSPRSIPSPQRRLRHRRRCSLEGETGEKLSNDRPLHPSFGYRWVYHRLCRRTDRHQAFKVDNRLELADVILRFRRQP